MQPCACLHDYMLVSIGERSSFLRWLFFKQATIKMWFSKELILQWRRENAGVTCPFSFKLRVALLKYFGDCLFSLPRSLAVPSTLLQICDELGRHLLCYGPHSPDRASRAHQRRRLRGDQSCRAQVYAGQGARARHGGPHFRTALKYGVV